MMKVHTRWKFSQSADSIVQWCSANQFFECNMHHQGTIRLNNVTSTLVINRYTMETHFVLNAVLSAEYYDSSELKENDADNNPPSKWLPQQKASFERSSANIQLQTTIEQSSLSIYMLTGLVLPCIEVSKTARMWAPSKPWLRTRYKYEQINPPANQFLLLKQIVSGIEIWLDDVTCI